MYEYRATVLRVVDGDTIHAAVDLGCDVTIGLTIRLYGINAPEMKTPLGPPAKQHLTDLIGLNPVLEIHTVKDRREKYGRYLATLIRADGTDLNAQMVRDGFAVAYIP